jgi:CBS domain-containing protein
LERREGKWRAARAKGTFVPVAVPRAATTIKAKRRREAVVMTARDALQGGDRQDLTAVSGAQASVQLFTGDVVATVRPDATLQQAAETLVADDVGLLVVGTTDKVEGVVSERDLVRAVALGRDPRTTQVRDVASRRLVWCDATAIVAEVGELMMEQYVRHVLVEDADRLVGVVSARDLLGAYVAGPD